MMHRYDAEIWHADLAKYLEHT